MESAVVSIHIPVCVTSTNLSNRELDANLIFVHKKDPWSLVGSNYMWHCSVAGVDFQV